MTDQSLVPAEEARIALALASQPMSDDEITRMGRTAQALAASGIYKDVRSAEQAFAKLVVGRSLRIGDHQALSLYIIDGKVEVPYNLMGAFVRRREGYDYRPAWLKKDKGDRPVAVWCDEEELTDTRDVVGAAIAFTVDGEQRGISRWTIEDSVRAGLERDRGGKTSLHKKFPRNMFLARAMSNGIKWFVPEVAEGMPIYAEGEIERVPNLSSTGEAEAEGPGWGDLTVQQIVEIEHVIRRAKRLGHQRLADKPTAQMALRDQSPKRVAAWIKTANETLAAFKTEEPDNAEVVDGEPEEATREPREAEEATAEPQRSEQGDQGELPIGNSAEERTDA